MWFIVIFFMQVTFPRVFETLCLIRIDKSYYTVPVFFHTDSQNRSTETLLFSRKTLSHIFVLLCKAPEHDSQKRRHVNFRYSNTKIPEEARKAKQIKVAMSSTKNDNGQVTHDFFHPSYLIDIVQNLGSIADAPLEDTTNFRSLDAVLKTLEIVSVANPVGNGLVSRTNTAIANQKKQESVPLEIQREAAKSEYDFFGR